MAKTYYTVKFFNPLFEFKEFLKLKINSPQI